VSTGGDDKRFTIGLDINNQDARQATQEVKVDLSGVEAAALRMVKAVEDGLKKLGRDNRSIAKQQREDWKQLFDELQKGHDRSAEGARKFGGASSLAMGAAAAGTQKLLDLLGGIPAAFAAAEQAQQRFSGRFASQQDQLAELAAISGQPLDATFVRQFAQFNRRTGFRAQESLAFQQSLLNTGAQYVGRNISEPEARQFQEQLGQLALARGLDPSIAGNIGGTALALTNYNQFGEGASEEATTRVNRALAILGRGAGENRALAESLTKVTAASVNEDSLRGSFRSMDEAAALISTMAEGMPQETEVYTRATLRGLRDFEGTAKPLLEKAGITPQTPTLEAIQRLAPVVEEEARRKGLTIQDVLAQYFPDERTSKGLAVAINRGVAGGVIEDRLKYGQQFGRAETQAQIDAYRKSNRGRMRMADAAVESAEITRGAATEEVDILRRRALARMIESGQIGSVSNEMTKFIQGVGSFGALGSEGAQIDAQVQTELRQKLLEAGGQSPFGEGIFGDRQDLDPNARANQFNAAIGRLREKGVDPLYDPMAERGGVEIVRPPVKVQVVEDQPKVMTKPTPGGGRAAVPR
jgi:hypothetical protein